jgi:hypothetical protein
MNITAQPAYKVTVSSGGQSCEVPLYSVSVSGGKKVTLYLNEDIRLLTAQALQAAAEAKAAAEAVMDKLVLRAHTRTGVIDADDQYQITEYPDNVQATQVFLNGILTHPDDYTIDTNGLLTIGFDAEGYNVTVLILYTTT